MHPFRAVCRRCGSITVMPRAVVKFFCINCGQTVKTGLGRYGNPLVPRVNCIQCGYNFAIEPADYCTNPLHRRAYEARVAEAAAAEARRHQPVREPATWEGIEVKVKRGEDGKWKVESREVK